MANIGLFCGVRRFWMSTLLPRCLHPTHHHTLHPTPYTLHPAPYTLHPTPYTLHLIHICTFVTLGQFLTWVCGDENIATSDWKEWVSFFLLRSSFMTLFLLLFSSFPFLSSCFLGSCFLFLVSSFFFLLSSFFLFLSSFLFLLSSFFFLVSCFLFLLFSSEGQNLPLRVNAQLPKRGTLDEM